MAVEARSWASSLESASGQKILVATGTGAHLQATTLESIVAAALTLRGARVHVLLCDKALRACTECTIPVFSSVREMVDGGPQKDLCGACFGPAKRMYQALGVKVHRLGKHVSKEEHRLADRLSREIPYGSIATYQWEGHGVGEQALAGALRFFARGTLDGEPLAEPVLRRYLHAAIVTAMACRNLFAQEGFSCVVGNHGIYVPQGVIGEVARKAGVRVVNWAPTYRAKTFLFSHERSYHYTMIDEPLDTWQDMEWGEAAEAHVMKYLKDRWSGAQDWITYSDKPLLDLRQITKEIGVDFGKPCIGLLTNVMWDAQLYYPSCAYPNMLEWIHDTIRHFASRKDLQLLIRVHPAELKNPNRTRQTVVEEIKRVFPELPPNVFIIPPESEVSTYAAMMGCNAAIIYGTKTAVELASFGVPIIVAGEAWIRNKGITIDAETRDDYHSILSRLPLPGRMDEAAIRRARKYAFHFFFRRMISLEPLVASHPDRLYQLNVQSMDQLKEGRHPVLDVICDGILHGKPFVYKQELAFASPGAAAPREEQASLKAPAGGVT